MATAVLCLAVGLLSFVGLTVTSLRFPVNPASPRAAACLRTIGLASPAPAADAEPQTAETAADLHQKQKNDLRPCKPSEAMVKIRWFVELPIACGALLKARSWRFGLSFLFLQKSQRVDSEEIERRITLLLSGGKQRVKMLSILSVGQTFEQRWVTLNERPRERMISRSTPISMFSCSGNA